MCGKKDGGKGTKGENDFQIFPNDIQIFQANFRRFQMRFRNLHVNFRSRSAQRTSVLSIWTCLSTFFFNSGFQRIEKLFFKSVFAIITTNFSFFQSNRFSMLLQYYKRINNKITYSHSEAWVWGAVVWLPTCDGLWQLATNLSLFKISSQVSFSLRRLASCLNTKHKSI